MLPTSGQAPGDICSNRHTAMEGVVDTDFACLLDKLDEFTRLFLLIVRKYRISVHPAGLPARTGGHRDQVLCHQLLPYRVIGKKVIDMHSLQSGPFQPPV